MILVGRQGVSENTGAHPLMTVNVYIFESGLLLHHTPNRCVSNLGSCKPGSQLAAPHSWWADGCAGTGSPSLERRTSRTWGATRCRSPAGNAPVGLCSSTRTGSRKRWQTRPKSVPEELHPRGRLWPACNTEKNVKLNPRQHVDLKNRARSRAKQVWNAEIKPWQMLCIKVVNKPFLPF